VKEEKNDFNSLHADLLMMDRLIKKHFHKFINDTSSILKAADSFRRFSKDSKDYWKYNLSGLTFKNIEPEIVMLPHQQKDKIEVEELAVKLSVDIIGTCPTKFQLVDPFVNIGHQLYTVQWILQGNLYDYEENNEKFLKNAWHLDRHFDNTPSDFFHPHYHLHNGGYALTNDESLETGNLMILESPRVMHPPLDGILAIDFVIRNFYKESVHKKLTTDKDYQKILKNSQFMFWRPYFLALAANWAKFSDANYDISLKYDVILPNLQK
jgi:hypothetical protein